MIKRYSRKELTDIWSEENKYKIWLDVEIAAAQAMENLGQIPKGVSSTVRKKAKINVKRIQQIESFRSKNHGNGHRRRWRRIDVIPVKRRFENITN